MQFFESVQYKGLYTLSQRRDKQHSLILGFHGIMCGGFSALGSCVLYLAQ